MRVSRWKVGQMSQHTLLGHPRLRFAEPMVGRDSNEQHRAATPLELFFDLVFVVAVALAADGLHHGVAEGAVAASVLSFVLVFFAIYWAWVNFTWFASAYDTDDVVFRLFVFTTMTGALIFAAGVPRVFHQLDFTVVSAGYAVMRVALVVQWLRVARHDSDRRATARRFAACLTVLQVGWLAVLALPPEWYLPAWVVLALGELTAPVWAEAASHTTWNAEHISERYGLFMLIVLGESVLAASRAIQTAIDDGGLTAQLASVIVGGLLIVFSIWWIYFDRPEDRLLSSLRTAFVWSYLHVLVFSAVAAVGAGLAVTIEAGGGRAGLGRVGAGATVAAPLVVCLLSLWGMYVRADDPPIRKFGVPVTAGLVVASAFTGAASVLLMGLVVSALVVLKTAISIRTQTVSVS
jgi:low temperature requirement protein LtrA